MRPRASLIATAAVVAVVATPAMANPPVPKIYDCYANTSIGLSYVQAIELKTKSHYLVAPFRKGDHLDGKVATGRYRAKGNRVTWLSGPYAKRYRALFHPKTATAGPYLELDRANGSWTGVSCYPH